MYQPNVKQLSDVITKYITLLNIREYKTNIIYLLQIFATSEMAMVEKEYNYILQIDYEAEQSPAKWNEGTHDEFISFFFGQFDEPDKYTSTKQNYFVFFLAPPGRFK